MAGRTLNNRTVILGSVISLIIIVTVFYWIFKPTNTQAQSHIETPKTQIEQLNPNSSQNMLVKANGGRNELPELAASLRGTEIDCPLQVDGNGKLILTSGIRNCFDYFFSALGERTEAQLINDLEQYFRATLPLSAAQYASYLLKQYVAYNRALKQQKPAAKPKIGDTDALQKVINQMSKLQQQYFTAAEIEALFGHQQRLNQFNLEQMKIYANKSLDTQQKAEQIAKLIDQLPTDLAEGVKISLQFAELQQLTEEIQKQGGSAQDIRAMRESLLGVDAANRLEKVDQEEASWHKQVNNYLQTRDQILKSDMNDASKQQSIAKLRSNSFKSQEEILRAQSFEIMHDGK